MDARRREMDAADVLESYVNDVARRLPIAKRGDVALELRSLLDESLQDRADAAGRPPDADMALDLLRTMGHPGETAVRYHRPFTLLEPQDTWRFVVAAVIGGVVVALLQPTEPVDAAATYAETTRGAAQSFLAWLGLLVLAFGVKNAVQRHNPDAFAWRPRPVRDLDHVNRPAVVGVLALLAASTVLYLWPGPVLELVTAGRFDAADLAYTGDFTSPLRQPWLVGIFAVTAGLYLVALVRGRWTPGLRLLRTAFLFCAALQLGWHVSYGSVFADPAFEETGLGVMAVASAVLWVVAGVQLYREYTHVTPAVAPAPGRAVTT